MRSACVCPCGAYVGWCALQVLIVQFGGEVFATQPLSAQQWGACVGIGALSLLVRGALCALPPHPRVGAALASGRGGSGEGE